MSFKIIFPFSIAAGHFIVANWLLPAAMTMVTGGGSVLQPPGFAVQVIVLMTKILHFPIISFSLYRREWVPGNWIYIPLVINSLIWAAGICLLVKIIQAALTRFSERQ